MLGLTVDTCSSTVLGGYWTNFLFFYVLEYTRILWSFHVLLHILLLGVLRLHGLPELIALEIWTPFLQPLASDRHFDAVSGLLEKSFPVFDMGGEVAGSPGV